MGEGARGWDSFTEACIFGIFPVGLSFELVRVGVAILGDRIWLITLVPEQIKRLPIGLQIGFEGDRCGSECAPGVRKPMEITSCHTFLSMKGRRASHESFPWRGGNASRHVELQVYSAICASIVTKSPNGTNKNKQTENNSISQPTKERTN